MIHGTTTRARAIALEGLFKEELVRLQVHRAIARACTAKCVCRTEILDQSSSCSKIRWLEYLFEVAPHSDFQRPIRLKFKYSKSNLLIKFV